MNKRLKKVYKTEVFCNNVKLAAVTSDKFNASLLKKSINFY